MVTPQSPDNQSPTAFLKAIENGVRGVISDESKKYCLELSESISRDVPRNRLCYRFYTENPSLQAIPTCDEIIGFLRRWMNLPMDFSGDMARAALRLEIRERFPLLPQHYVQWIAEADVCISSIQSVADPDLRKLTHVVQYAFASLRWLDDPTTPQSPEKPTINSADAMGAMLAIRRWLQGKLESSVHRVSPKPVEFIISGDDPTAIGNWLMPPLSLTELSQRLDDINPDKLHTLLDQFGLCTFPRGNRQSWTVRLDPPMPPSLRKKIETKPNK